MDATSESASVHAPGAEDNASETAMAIEAARVLAGERLPYTVKFIAFTGEEQGLYGSQHYAQELRQKGVTLIGVLNFDMVAWPGGDWGTQIVTDTASVQIAQIEAAMAATYTSLAHVIRVRGPFGSDQYPFQLQCYKAIAAIEYGPVGYQWYHTTGDTLGNLSMPLPAEVAKMATASIIALMEIPAPPADFAPEDAGTGGCLEASWTLNPDPDLAGHKLVWRDSALLSDTIYYYAVKAIDTSGRASPFSAEARGKAVTLDQGVLLVDETRNGVGTPGNPNDEQVDAFYHNLLQGFRTTDWDVTRQGVLLAGDIGPYSTIVWHGDDLQELRLGPAVEGLAGYLESGGRLWLVGWKPSCSLMAGIGGDPYLFRAGQFPFDFLHLSQSRLAQAQDFIAATGRLGYPDADIDSCRTLPAFHGRLPSIEVLVPRDAEPVLSYVSFSGDTAVQGKPVAVRWMNGSGRAIFLGFPLFHLKEPGARQIALRVMQDLGEPYAVAEADEPSPARVTVLTYPARGVVRFRFADQPSGTTQLTIYDRAGCVMLRRVLVKSMPGELAAEWDCSQAPAGAYLYRLTSGTGVCRAACRCCARRTGRPRASAGGSTARSG
jgi:hypothetical protein